MVLWSRKFGIRRGFGKREKWNSAGLDLTGGFRIDNPSGCKLYLAAERGIHFENLFQEDPFLLLCSSSALDLGILSWDHVIKAAAQELWSELNIRQFVSFIAFLGWGLGVGGAGCIGAAATFLVRFVLDAFLVGQLLAGFKLELSPKLNWSVPPN